MLCGVLVLPTPCRLRHGAMRRPHLRSTSATDAEGVARRDRPVATQNSGRWYLSTASELIVATALACCDPVTTRSTKFRGYLCSGASRLRRAAADR